MSTFLPFLYLIICVILPIIPAVILFKAIKSTGDATGTFQGWTFKFGGAFAGYVAVFLLIIFAIPRPKIPSEDKFRTYVVSGTYVDNENHELPDIIPVVRLKPPIESFSSRNFEFSFVDLSTSTIRSFNIHDQGGQYASSSIALTDTSIVKKRILEDGRIMYEIIKPVVLVRKADVKKDTSAVNKLSPNQVTTEILQ